SVSSIAAAPVASSSTAVGAPPVSPASSAPSGSTASAAPSGSPSRAAGAGPGPSSRRVKARARPRPPGSASPAQAYKAGPLGPLRVHRVGGPFRVPEPGGRVGARSLVAVGEGAGPDPAARLVLPGPGVQRRLVRPDRRHRQPVDLGGGRVLAQGVPGRPLGP